MNGTLDILTLIFLVLAVVIFIKLRSVLGRRTGHERPRYDPYNAEDANGNMPDNIVTLPRGETPRMSEELDQDTFARRLKEVAPEGGAVASKLQDIAKIDRSFDPKHFVTGAKSAYEMIVTAFAEGDRRALKNLLSKEVYDSFVSAIAERDQRGESVEFKFVGISKAEITDADIHNKTINVTIKFSSDIITATLNRSAEVIEGSPEQIREVIDFWTFSRDATSRDPNWKVVATGAGS
ncbi:MAG: Tim44/TimA family putative adaptor protein [Hyphomicrobiales bacterium]|nr:Tim44/TimA family putative adaptor protein [Hyphomicrobiales bacterium]